MALNYASMQEMASRLIAENGKTLTLTQHSMTPIDSARPWLGATAGVNAQSITCFGVVIPNEERDDKDDMRRGDATAYISATSFVNGSPPTLQDLVKFSVLIDNEGYSWHIHGVDIINPGPVRILFVATLEH